MDHCPANSNGCIRVNKFNQYRANNIEMRLPVTFKQVDLDNKIKEWARSIIGNEIVEVDSTSSASETKYYFYHTTWYGLVIDTLITVHSCSQVFMAQTVTMQSQTRVGFKDYGRNYEISYGLYDYLNKQVTTEGLKSFISCT
jgi:hypothetical protein